MSNKQKIAVNALSQPDHSGWMTKQGGSVKSWKRRYFVLKKNTLYYFKTQKDTDVTGTIEINGQTIVKKMTNSQKKNCFCVGGGPAKRVFLIFCDTEPEMNQWIAAINKCVEAQSGGAAAPIKPQGTPNANPSLAQRNNPNNNTNTAVVTAGNAGAGSPAGTDMTGIRGRLHQGKNQIGFLHSPDSKVLEFWQIWMESIPGREDIKDAQALITFEVSVSADMEKLSWRSSGPQNLFIQKMVDFFWNVGAPESEIDRLNDIGALINPSSIGSWIDMSARGGMDGGWFFPCDIQINFALEASDAGDPVAKVNQWTEQHSVRRCFSVGRDMGAAPPRQTEIRMEMPGDLAEQLEKVASAFESFGFPPIGDQYIQLIRENPTENISLSVITSSEGFVRMGLLYPRPSESVLQTLCGMSDANQEKVFKFQGAFGVDGPTWVEFQHLNTGFGYGVYKEGFDVVFHYTVGSEGPQ